LFKRGDSFTENIFNVRYGHSATEPFVLSSYGDSTQRPIFKTGSESGIVIYHNTFQYLVIIGLDFYAHTRNPNSDEFINHDGGAGFRLYRRENFKLVPKFIWERH
jgi:hypothetical protein